MICLRPFKRSLFLADATARSPRMNTTPKQSLQGLRWRIVRFLSLGRRDHPYLGEIDFHSCSVTPCSLSQSRSCFHVGTDAPRAASISFWDGGLGRSIKAFSISKTFLSLSRRAVFVEGPGMRGTPTLRGRLQGRSVVPSPSRPVPKPGGTRSRRRLRECRLGPAESNAESHRRVSE